MMHKDLKCASRVAVGALPANGTAARPDALAPYGLAPATFANDAGLAVIAGPCQLESRDHGLKMAEALAQLAARCQVSIVYKSSFDKANRTSHKGARGIGLARACEIFAEIRKTFHLPVVTDIHTSAQCARVAPFVDMLQIPAFLCRQTDLVRAAARTGKPVNVKKGQFVAPHDMHNVVAKILDAGNDKILLTERGTCFGYNMLVNDMRALPVMAQTGAPVIFDATHSVQQPGGKATASGGRREFVAPLARAAVAVGVAGVFIETHDDPDHAPSDGPCMVPLRDMAALLDELKDIDALVKARQAKLRAK